MSINTDISTKLDGNIAKQGAEARGHVCNWACLKNLLPECAHNDDQAWEELKQKQVQRSEKAIKRIDPFEKFNIDPIENHIFHWTFLNDLKLLPKPKKSTRFELGAREFTLTYSPKWMDDAQARVEMEQAMNKLIRYYEGQFEKLRAVGEVGSNGLSHIHCFYKMERGLKITDKNFKRAWKYWNPKKILGRGFEGGHHATVKEESDFLGYIEKDIETSWLDINLSSKIEA